MIVSPGKWVSEEQLIALKGIKKGTLKVSASSEPSGLFPPAPQK